MTHKSSDSSRWASHPILARAVRAAMFVVPFLAAMLIAFALSTRLPAATSLPTQVVRWVAIVAVATLGMQIVDRCARRLLPLTVLLQLTLLFPDRAPSRLKLAMRAGTIDDLEERLRHARTVPDGETPQEAAERLLDLVALLSHHDHLTRGHSERVRGYAHLIGEELQLNDHELDMLRWAALLHDVGKTAISTDILNKPGRLTPDEFDVIKTHPDEGRALVEPLADWLGDSVNAVWEHHERFDGRGYPQGLEGADISFAARVVSVADSFDVMTSARSYKDPMPASAARAELANCSGTQFDPIMVRAFLNVSLGRLRLMAGPAAFFAQLALFEPSGVVHAGNAASSSGSAGAAGATAGSSGVSSVVAGSGSGSATTAVAAVVSVAASTAGMVAASPPASEPAPAETAAAIVTESTAPVTTLGAPTSTVIVVAGTNEPVADEAASPIVRVVDEIEPVAARPDVSATTIPSPDASIVDDQAASTTTTTTRPSTGSAGPSPTSTTTSTTTTSIATTTTGVPITTPVTVAPTTTTTTTAPTTTTTTTTTVAPTTTTTSTTTTTTTTTTTVPPSLVSTNSTIYLGGDVTADISDRFYHPLSNVSPPDIALANYDTDVDEWPGAFVRRSQDGIYSSDFDDTLDFESQIVGSIDGDVHLDLHVAADGFAKRDVRIEAALIQCRDGNCWILGIDERRVRNADRFKKRTFLFKDIDTVFQPGDSLVVIVATLDTSESDAMVAFGTADFDAHIDFDDDD